MIGIVIDILIICIIIVFIVFLFGVWIGKNVLNDLVVLMIVVF